MDVRVNKTLYFGKITGSLMNNRKVTVDRTSAVWDKAVYRFKSRTVTVTAAEANRPERLLWMILSR